MNVDSNAYEVIYDLERIKRKVDRNVAAAIFRGLYLLRNDVRRATPVNTSWLRRSWHAVVRRRAKPGGYEHEGIMGTNVFYAPYVEFGTGVFAQNGKGRKTPWVYYLKNNVGRYKKGYHWTIGQKPKLMLTKSWEKDERVIQRYIEEAFKLR